MGDISSPARVLVTGGSGFVAGHCILRLLADLHRVRATVRSGRAAAAVRELVARHAPASASQVEVIEVDLMSDDGWAVAAAGCEYVLHVASPYPAVQPKDESTLIQPARDGTLRVLRAALRAGARRVVVTSSFAAVGYGHPQAATSFDETDWTDVDARGVTAYAKSKTLAERTAWEFAAREGLELAVVNPTGVVGPALGPDLGTSLASIALLLNGGAPALPRASIGLVDVRDVADLHVRAMTDPVAVGERFLATAGVMTLPEIAALLRSELGTAAARVPRMVIPDWLVRTLAVFDPGVRQTLPMLGPPHRGSSEKAMRMLNWAPRSAEQAVLATAQSILDNRPAGR